MSSRCILAVNSLGRPYPELVARLKRFTWNARNSCDHSGRPGLEKNIVPNLSLCGCD